MKRLWLVVLFAGIVLLFATTSNYNIVSVIGLAMFGIGSYKLNLFKE